MADLEEQLNQFALFLGSRLAELGQGDYFWNFGLTNPPAWVPRGWGAGTTLQEANRLLSLAGDQLRGALQVSDGGLALEAVRVIMDWGGVWNGQSQGHGNQATVQAIGHAKICGILVQNIAAVSECRPAEVTHMNAGWSKVYAVAITDPATIIYDSRVARALAKNVQLWENRELHGRSSALREPFRQLPSLHHQPIQGFPNMNGSLHAHTLAVCLASELVRRMLSLADHATALHGAWFRGRTVRDVEARLFMLGGD